MKNFLSFLICLLALAKTSSGQCPTPSFTYSLTPSNISLLGVYFNSTTNVGSLSPNYYMTYQIKYGDGAVSGTIYSGGTSHNYSTPGTYTAKMIITVTDSATSNIICKDSVTQNVTVAYTACGSTFSTTSNGNYSLTFTANTPSNNPNVIYHWSFGDGTGGTGSPVTHIYPNSGYYTVQLIATDSTTTPVCSSVISSSTVYVPMVSNPCANHHAYFTKSINGLTVSFSNTSTSHAGQTKNSLWQFGDGTTSTSLNTLHTYANPGTYTVKLKNTWTDSANTTTVCVDSFVSTVTLSAPPNVISGYVVIDSNLSLNPSYKVWLIKHDSVSNSLAAVDSYSINNGGSWAYYAFNNKPAGDYLVKAAMLNQTSTTGYIPTYHDSSLYWNQATYIHHVNTNSYQNIYMRTGIVTAGPGFIGGNVSLGANRGTGNGVAGQIVYLKDASNQVIKSAVTDNNGDFSFSNLSVGTYSLYPEEMNYVTTPITGISITASHTNATGYLFGKTSTEIKPKSTSVSTVSTQNHVIFPNPANTKLFIRWAQTPQNVAITISDLAGHKVYQSTGNPASGGNTEVNIAQIPAGIYFLILENDGVKYTEKLVIQH